MKITDVCIDAYREECERAETESLDIKEQEIAEIALPKELLSELEKIRFFEQDTLVGALRAPRQLGICLKRRFYHIPAVYVEEYAIPKYIALYQSQKMFGDEVSGIKYYGEVKRCTPMRRSKIREIPKNSNELYYKFKIKKWKRLDKAVESKELGFVRLFTNSFLLQNVGEVSALTISDVGDFTLYKLLSLSNEAICGECAVTRFITDGFDVIFTKEVIYLCYSGKIIERYWRSSLESTPSLVLRKLKKDIENYTDRSKMNGEKENEVQNI